MKFQFSPYSLMDRSFNCHLKQKEINKKKKTNKKMKLRVQKFLQFELKIGVVFLIGFVIFVNLAIVIYGEMHTFQRSDSRFLRIVLSFGELTLYQRPALNLRAHYSNIFISRFNLI